MKPVNEQYFSRTWALLTRERGWWKPLLILGLAIFVPIVGWLAVAGYSYEWARLAAWGGETSPKRKDVRIGTYIVSGWRAIVVIFVWLLVLGIAKEVLRGLVVPVDPFTGVREDPAWLSLLFLVAELMVGIVAEVAALRAVIYGKITAGLRPTRVFEMVDRDPKGLFKLLAIPIVGGLIVLVAAMIMLLPLGVMGIGAAGMLLAGASASTGYSAGAVIYALQALLSAVPLLFVYLFVLSVLSVATGLIEVHAIGLWMSQFDVRSWEGPADALPSETPGLPGASAGE